MKKLKVLQLCHDDKGPFVPLCAMYLKGLASDQYTVHTMFLRGGNQLDLEEALEGSEVHLLKLEAKALRGLKLAAIAKVVDFCRQQDIDLVVAHRYKAIYIAALASFFVPLKVWGAAHGHDVFKRWGRRFLLQYLRPNIQVIAVSEAVVADVLKDCPRLERDRVTSLPNCLDEAFESQLLPRFEARKKFGLKETQYVLGTVGRLVDSKSQQLLVRALAKCSIPNSVVIIIGDGPEFEPLQQLAESLGVADRVILPGNIDRAFRMMTAFDAFVFPSGEKEGFGLVLLEAMMARVPIISSNSDGPAEVVADTALIFPVGDLESLVRQMQAMYQQSEAERKALIERAYSRWQNQYSVSCFKRRFSALLSAL